MNNEFNLALGATIQQVENSFRTSYNINSTLAGMLSDAQELIDMGDTKSANEMINRVKHYFFEFTDTRNSCYAQKNESN